MQAKHAVIDNEFEEEVRQLEVKYYQRHLPLWQRVPLPLFYRLLDRTSWRFFSFQRSAIIAGTEEPTEEEVGADDEEEEAPKIEEIKEGTEEKHGLFLAPSMPHAESNSFSREAC